VGEATAAQAARTSWVWLQRVMEAQEAAASRAFALGFRNQIWAARSSGFFVEGLVDPRQ
jgi:hypothetical protein